MYIRYDNEKCIIYIAGMYISKQYYQKCIMYIV